MSQDAIMATRPYLIAISVVVAVIMIARMIWAVRQKRWGEGIVELVAVTLVVSFPFWINSIPFLPKPIF